MRRVLVTRSPHQASELAEQLLARGLEPVLIPTIEQVPPTSFAALDAALAELDGFHWIIFTSANAVSALVERAATFRLDLSSTRLPPVAAIGSATARAVTQQLGVAPALVPEKAVAESLAEALRPHARRPDGTPNRFLLPRAEVARDLLPDALEAAGGVVVIAPAYRTVIPPHSAESLRQLFADEASWPDAILFTSSSTAENLAALLELSGLTLPEKVRRISIGPITSSTMRRLHMPPHREASQSTLDALVEVCIEDLVG